MVPWGVVSGVAMVGAGLTSAQALGMSVLVFAGSAQLAVVPLIVVKAPVWVMCMTALMVNLRYIIYSAVLAPHFGHLSRPFRSLLAYLTVDGMFALFVGRFHGAGVTNGAGTSTPAATDQSRHWFYLGGSLLLWVAWQTSTVIGVFGGAFLPRGSSFEFAATLALIALLMPLLYDRAVVCGAIAAGLVALVARGLPMNLGIVAAVTLGVATGFVVAPFLPSPSTGGHRER
jgi:predicted branched-subunit amino acid permease